MRAFWRPTLRPPCPFQPLGSPARPSLNCSCVNGEVPWAKVILSRGIVNKDKNKEVNKPDKGEEMYKDKEKEDMVFEVPVPKLNGGITC